MACFVHLICDYAPGDLAWSEVFSSFYAFLPESCKIHMTAVGSFETISTGFAVAQLGLADRSLRPENLIVFANCAPRKDRRSARINNEGEGLLFGVLSNEVEILAVNSGYSLSFIRDELQTLWSVHVQEEGSQFRSRDYFPKIVDQLVRKDYSFKNHLLDPKEIIPKPPAEVIAYVDSFGNLKTTIRQDHPLVAKLKSGDRVRIIIENRVRTASVATGSFNVMEGDLAFAPGSSGHERRFWELFQRGGSAWIEFGKPAVGAHITVEETIGANPASPY